MSADKKNTPPADDPNSPDNPLAAEAVAERSEEERLAEAWERWRMPVYVVVVAVLLGVIVTNLFDFMQERERAALAEDYRRIDTTADRVAFAQSHGDHPLAGVAYLKAADSAYEEEDFATAAERYAAAIPLLAEQPGLQGRARVGEAVALIRGGDEAAGAEQLDALAGDAAAMDLYRAQAAYLLAVDQLDKGEEAAARENLQRVLELDEPTEGFLQSLSYQVRAQELLDRLDAGGE